MSASSIDTMPKLCHHCEAVATKLCDFHIGRVIGGYVRDGSPDSNRWRAVMSAESEEQFYTCDRPLCGACSTDRGRVFVCGPEPFVDTYDHCRDHAKADGHDAPMLLPEEAERIRRELRLRLTPPRGKAELVKL